MPKLGYPLIVVYKNEYMCICEVSPVCVSKLFYRFRDDFDEFD